MTTLLITGVTGLLSGTALEKIFHQETRLNLLLLMRAGSPEAGLEQVKENMRKFSTVEERLAMLHPQHIPLGDSASPEHSLNDPRPGRVAHVLNRAAVASLGSSLLIRKVNVEGTLRLAQRMAQVEGLQRFLHAGTAMLYSPEPDSLVAESAEFREHVEHLVEYAHLKSIIEQLIQQHHPTLPLAIARPSIVMGHTHHGCRPSSSTFRVFSMGLMLQKSLCSTEDRIDVIPMDHYADAPLMLFNQPLVRDEVVYISVGEENSMKFAEIDRVMAQALEQAPMGDKYTQVSCDTLVKMRRELKGMFELCNERPILRAVRLYGAFAMLSVRLSNNKLLSMGMPKPPYFTGYIDRCAETTRGLSIPQQMAVDFK